jgi:hypothetical protein
MAENESVFVEQAEYLDSAMFSSWFVEHPKEVEILRKLKASGAKLLIGPRGTGKTTLMLKALNEMSFAGGAETLPAYVNFKTSLRLEPLYKTSGNATFWFNQWLFLNAAIGLANSLENLGLSSQPKINNLPIETAKKIVDSLQSGDLDTAKKLLETPVTISEFNSYSRECLNICDRVRIVFLFDDAAHAFSSDQQRDFFDFFRLIKSPSISPKAAIYPGVTNFSSAFHVGHDAEQVDIWLDPTDPRYLNFMRSLVNRRLSDSTATALTLDDATFQLLALSAFGIPRNMLNMVRKITTSEETDNNISSKKKTFSRTAVLSAIAECGDTSQQIFKSLKAKIPTYSSFVDQGLVFLKQAIQTIKDYNSKTTKAKTVTLALTEPLANELKTLLSFLEYSGLVRPRGNVSRGVKGTFALFDIHYALLVDSNAVLAQKAFTIADVAESLSKRDAHAFVRTSAEKLLGTNDIAEILPLQLPPCEVCNTPRASSEAKFCLNCGSPLSLKSTFETAVQQSISLLPLTPGRIKSISSQSSIQTVKDVLLDKEHKELLKVKMIGPVWATRIFRYAEEFVE